MASRAGLLVRRGRESFFLPASTVHGLVPAPKLSRLPWDDAELALVGGEVVAVLDVGESSGVLLLCDVNGEALALSGLSPERAGFWPESERGVRVDGKHISEFDLAGALRTFRGRRESLEGAQR